MARAFADFPETPVGIVEWDLPPPARAAPVRLARAAAGRARALARGRRYASVAQIWLVRGDAAFALVPGP